MLTKARLAFEGILKDQQIEVFLDDPNDARLVGLIRAGALVPVTDEDAEEWLAHETVTPEPDAPRKRAARKTTPAPVVEEAEVDPDMFTLEQDN